MSDLKRPDPRGPNKMGVMPVGKLLFSMALPMSIAMLVQACYNVVDSIYVSRISESSVTALSLAFPIQNLMIGFATGVGVGVNSLLSKSLGEGNRERGNQYAGNGIFMMVVSIMLFVLVGLFLVRPFYEMQSEVRETVESGTTYAWICTVFSAGIFVEILGERLLQATGRTFYTMITQGTGAILNIILDPILIFGYFGLPAMGIAGAATATVIGQWVAAGLAIYFNLKKNEDVHLKLANLLPRKEILLPMLGVGIPSVIMMGIGAVMNFSINQILQGFTETATGVFGVYYKLQSFFCMPIFGMNNAAMSIIAYNYGARKPKRITGTLKVGCCAALCVMILGTLSFELIPHVLLSAFHPSEQFMTIGCRALRIIGVHFPVAAICIVLGSSFPALGNGLYSTITSLCRQLLVLLPVAYLMSLSGNLDNVWLAFPIAEVMSLIVTVILFTRVYRKKIKPLYQDQNG